MGLILSTDCGKMPASLLEMVASALVKNADGDIFFNIACYEAGDRCLESAISCGDPISDLEAFIVANGFTTDVCGNVAIKVLYCTTEEGEPQ